MTQLFLTKVPCPECGAPLEVDPACKIGTPWPRRIVPVDEEAKPSDLREQIRYAPAALCTGCHFCVELEVSHVS